MKRLWEFLCKLWSAETSSRKWCIFTVAVTAAVIGGAALLVFVVDPHYRYHEPFFYDKVYYEVYATAPNILKEENYDLLMLGTSMTRNFFLEDIEAAFDCRPVKLAASGGTVEDLCKFFEIAQKSKGEKLKRVIIAHLLTRINQRQRAWQNKGQCRHNPHSITQTRKLAATP